MYHLLCSNSFGNGYNSSAKWPQIIEVKLAKLHKDIKTNYIQPYFIKTLL